MPIASDSWVSFNSRIGKLNSYNTDFDTSIYTQSGYASITGYSSGNSSVVVINTSLGYYISGTPGHYIKKINNDNVEEWVTFDSLVSGDPLAIDLNYKFSDRLDGYFGNEAFGVGAIIAMNMNGACPCQYTSVFNNFDIEPFRLQDIRQNYSFAKVADSGALDSIPDIVYTLGQIEISRVIAGYAAIKLCTDNSPCYLYNEDCLPLTDSSGNVFRISNCTYNFSGIPNDRIIFLDNREDIEFVKVYLNASQILTVHSGRYIWPFEEETNLSRYDNLIANIRRDLPTDNIFVDTVASISLGSTSVIDILNPVEQYTANCFFLKKGDAVAVVAPTVASFNYGEEPHLGAGNSISLSMPAGLQAGDLLVAFVGVFDSNAVAVDVPFGWTKLHEISDSIITLAVLYKTATSEDITAGSITFTSGGSVELITASLSRIINTSGISDYEYNTDGGSFATSINIPAATPVGAPSLSLVCGFGVGGINTIASVTSMFTGTYITQGYDPNTDTSPTPVYTITQNSEFSLAGYHIILEAA